MRGYICIDGYTKHNNANARIMYKDGGKTKFLCSGIFVFERNLFLISNITNFIYTAEGIEILVETLLTNDWDENINIICKCDKEYLSLCIREYKEQIKVR